MFLLQYFCNYRSRQNQYGKNNWDVFICVSSNTFHISGHVYDRQKSPQEHDKRISFVMITASCRFFFSPEEFAPSVSPIPDAIISINEQVLQIWSWKVHLQRHREPHGEKRWRWWNQHQSIGISRLNTTASMRLSFTQLNSGVVFCHWGQRTLWFHVLMAGQLCDEITSHLVALWYDICSVLRFFLFTLSPINVCLQIFSSLDDKDFTWCHI